ncbi:GNAT family N-acetyltransferase [Fictibacillus sp. KIGAM418]|uniref:GNAT family N-acetyltransferase n=1 Tax=Fictibacillus marinisediminis TaxID=2878389 RepID=A0A9X1XAB5_9BACL|nr:GNAT family N-acetyltransferase [Fictibacillus marinisediminis]MCK6256863.1 GNAT family N-acetyltransferase [Fictibacillus marinisediminis]
MENRKIRDEDFDFFKEIIPHSHTWMKEEGLTGEENDEHLRSYLHRYDETGGEWLIWSGEGQKIGAAYLVYAAPSNQKPWLGTIVIHPEKRKQGFAKKIIEEISSMVIKNSPVLFSACPAENTSWIRFLNHNGFEQAGLENDEKGKEYIKFVKFLSDYD